MKKFGKHTASSESMLKEKFNSLKMRMQRERSKKEQNNIKDFRTAHIPLRTHSPDKVFVGDSFDLDSELLINPSIIDCVNNEESKTTLEINIEDSLIENGRQYYAEKVKRSFNRNSLDKNKVSNLNLNSCQKQNPYSNKSTLINDRESNQNTKRDPKNHLSYHSVDEKILSNNIQTPISMLCNGINETLAVHNQNNDNLLNSSVFINEINDINYDNFLYKTKPSHIKMLSKTSDSIKKGLIKEIFLNPRFSEPSTLDLHDCSIIKDRLNLRTDNSSITCHKDDLKSTCKDNLKTVHSTVKETIIKNSCSKSIQITDNTKADLNDGYLPNITNIRSSGQDLNYNTFYKNQYEIFTIEDMERHLNVKKIEFTDLPSNPVKVGEASFSEVFKINNVIYKIIPITKYYTREAFIKECFVLDLIKEQEGVCIIYDCFFVEGKYTDNYLRAWELYKNVKGTENEHPSSYLDSQEYGCIIMNDCGKDLESYKFESSMEIIRFLFKLVRCLYNLERNFSFEHRDMHWGNIMIKDGNVFLIDFNLSRLETSKVVYNDLSEQEWLFSGDSKVDRQFEVYKKMKINCRNSWIEFHKVTNVYWLKYLIGKLKKKSEELKAREYKKAENMILKIERGIRRLMTVEDIYFWLIKNFDIVE